MEWRKLQSALTIFHWRMYMFTSCIKGEEILHAQEIQSVYFAVHVSTHNMIYALYDK